jgi:hypothetical protein
VGMGEGVGIRLQANVGMGSRASEWHGLQVRVHMDMGIGIDFRTRELSNKPQIIKNG